MIKIWIKCNVILKSLDTCQIHVNFLLNNYGVVGRSNRIPENTFVKEYLGPCLLYSFFYFTSRFQMNYTYCKCSLWQCMYGKAEKALLYNKSADHLGQKLRELRTNALGVRLHFSSSLLCLVSIQDQGVQTDQSGWEATSQTAHQGMKSMYEMPRG